MVWTATIAAGGTTSNDDALHRDGSNTITGTLLPELANTQAIGDNDKPIGSLITADLVVGQASAPGNARVTLRNSGQQVVFDDQDHGVADRGKGQIRNTDGTMAFEALNDDLSIRKQLAHINYDTDRTTFAGEVNAPDYFENGLNIKSTYAPLNNVVLKSTGGSFDGNISVRRSDAPAQVGVVGTGVSGQMFINGTTVFLRTRDTDAAADQQRFSLINSQSQFRIDSDDDALSGAGNTALLTARHTGGVAIGAPLGGAPVNPGQLNAMVLYMMNVTVQTTSDQRLKDAITDLNVCWDHIYEWASSAAEWEWKDPDKHVSEPLSGFVAQRLEQFGHDELVITDHPGEDNETKRIDKAVMPMLAQAMCALREIDERLTTLENA